MTGIDSAELSALIDRVVSDLLELKAALGGDTITPAVEDLIDTATAAERFGMSSDTVRWLCESKGFGEKRGGRWMVSLSALQAYKREKRE
ncbi:helix-turn-helix domain-containing protein [Neorhizobium sp. CSC1952]|uniref:helix-turn-helix domain-containing protein n=1 Tax=Neorhizobium sp. CSC1952 TaxID=2978974 RepID=UPI0025A4FB11|nr:helix-turn-helix domain-containing protein [Rhizobium sp. CSC1952]WJR67660.1 helix-turn-helix domain-containing protein [Rhizobium sp. CSC1952]